MHPRSTLFERLAQTEERTASDDVSGGERDEEAEETHAMTGETSGHSVLAHGDGEASMLGG